MSQNTALSTWTMKSTIKMIIFMLVIVVKSPAPMKKLLQLRMQNCKNDQANDNGFGDYCKHVKTNAHQGMEPLSLVLDTVIVNIEVA